MTKKCKKNRIQYPHHCGIVRTSQLPLLFIANMSYLLLKSLHISCAALSYALFVLRGIWHLNNASILRQRWVSIVPHLIDTLLLTSALALAATLQQYPFVNDWLTAKFFALLLYIVLGSVALKYASSRILRLTTWLAAQAIFGYIVLVALHKNLFIFS